MNPYLFKHRIDGDVGACASYSCAAVNDDGSAFRRVSLHGFADVSQNRERVARNTVVGPAGVVKLLDFALANGSFLAFQLVGKLKS